MSLYHEFELRARERAEHILVRDFEGQSTYAEVYRLSQAIGAHLSEILPAGSHIGVMLPNIRPVFGIIQGILGSQNILVPLNYLLRPEEILNIIVHGEIRLIFTLKEWGQPLQQALKTKNLKTAFVFVDDPSSFGPVMQGSGKIHSGAVSDLAMILFTSGTTGIPKGVMLTHQNLQHNVRASSECFEMVDQDCIFGVLPFFHTFALMATLFLPIHRGVSVFLMPRFKPKDFIEAINRFQISFVPLVPSMLRVLYASVEEPEQLKPIRMLVSGGEALGKSLGEKFFKRFGIVIAEGYGMTETSPVISANFKRNPQKLGAVGQPIPQTEVQIRDLENKVLGVNQVGEITVRSPSVMSGYYKSQAHTDQVLCQDGFLRTGDLGYLDEDGDIFIVGRSKDVIISGGENIYPAEIEEIVNLMEGVMECAVIPGKSKLRGEEVVLVVSPEIEEAGLRKFIHQNLAPFKRPRRIVCLPQLPKSPSGKILKQELVQKFGELEE